MTALEYIQSRPALNHRELCRQIYWNPSSFSQWVNDGRPIPEDKEIALEGVLVDYGYDKDS